MEHLVVLQFTRSLAELEYADFVRHILVDKIGLKGLVVGYDHRFGKNREGTFEKLKELADRTGCSPAAISRILNADPTLCQRGDPPPRSGRGRTLELLRL